MTGLLAAVALYGLPEDPDPIALVFAALWATLHFILVSIAILEETVGTVAAGIATLTALAALAIVPRAVQASIEDDSSTASLVHIWDPVLMAVPVGVVVVVAWLYGRRRAADLSEP